MKHQKLVGHAQQDGTNLAINSNIVSNATQESIKTTHPKRIASSAKQTPLLMTLLVSPSASRVAAVSRQ